MASGGLKMDCVTDLSQKEADRVICGDEIVIIMQMIGNQ
jgi:hypothetical protein